MADTTPLKGTSSYTTLLRAMDDAATPLPMRLLRMSHTGRVIEDGLAAGTQRLVSSIIGMPRDLYEFTAERIKGKKSATPEAERVMSSAWLEKNMEDVYTKSSEFVGKPRPQLRKGTADGLIHIGSQFVPMVGSFFIPGVGEAQLVTSAAKYGKAAEMLATVGGKAGFQLNAADMTTLAISGAEKVAGIERPTEMGQPVHSEVLAKARTGTSAIFSDAVAATTNKTNGATSSTGPAQPQQVVKLDM